MTKVYKILVFPGGTEVGMEIYRSLINCKEVNLYSASSETVNHASYIYKNHFVIRDIYAQGWIDDLNEIILKEKIDFVFPAHSFVIDAISANRTKIKAELMLCNNDVLSVARSKSKTYDLLKNEIPVPKIYKRFDEVERMPVFIKPDNSYGAQGAERIDSKKILQEIFEVKDKYLVCEFLEGEEYTIDCFSDKNCELVFCEGRTRERIRMGTSMHSEKVDRNLDRYFVSVAEIILSKIKIIGPWFFQMKKDGTGILKLLEVEPRIAGTMAFHRVKGINFPLLYLYTLLDYKLSTLVNEFEINIDRALVNRYKHSLKYKTVYIDLDDTIIVHDRLNIDLIKFLYQCLNNRIIIVLISKSLRKEKTAYLKQWRIEQLFDEVIWLSESDSKANYIDVKRDPIFIDDSFSQRVEVARKHAIPTFDPSMIEVLLDERI